MIVTGFKNDPDGPWIEIDPEAIKDYSIDWTDNLPNGDSIATSVWSAENGILASAPDADTSIATIWLAPGTVTEGKAYRITNKITTAQGRTDRRSFRLVVRPQ